MQPIKDWVLVEPVNKEKTENGFFVPSSQEDIKEGVVISVGPGIWQNGVFVPTEVELNDKILYKPFGLIEVDHNGKKHYLMKEDNIIAKL